MNIDLSQPVQFIDSREFHEAGADERILTPAPPRKVPKPLEPNATPFERMCCDEPLTRYEEKFYFRKMNYLKFKAERLRLEMVEDVQRCTSSDSIANREDQILALVTEATEIRNLLIGANMRLISYFARVRHRKLTDEKISDYIMALIRCVGGFSHGFNIKFSTYAMQALTYSRRSFKPGPQSSIHDGESDPIKDIEDHRYPAPDRRSICQDNERAVSRALRTLPDRWRQVMERRYGIGRDEETQASVAEDVGVAHSRIGQIEKRARRDLRNRLNRFMVAEMR